MKMKPKIIALILLTIVGFTKGQHRQNRTLTNEWTPGEGRYIRVPLLQPRAKSKQVPYTEWFNQSPLDGAGIDERHQVWLSESQEDGGGMEKRHLEMFEGLFEGSESEATSSATTERGFVEDMFTLDDDDDVDDDRHKLKADNDLRRHRKKYVKVNQYFLPLLMAYKLKFFTMVPLLIGALVLLMTTTGMAGFFFALFAAATGLHNKNKH